MTGNADAAAQYLLDQSAAMMQSLWKINVVDIENTLEVPFCCSLLPAAAVALHHLCHCASGGQAVQLHARRRLMPLAALLLPAACSVVSRLLHRQEVYRVRRRWLRLAVTAAAGLNTGTLLLLQAVCAHVCQEPGQSSKVLKARAAALCSLGVIFQVEFTDTIDE